jgi:hypothetical protein
MGHLTIRLLAALCLLASLSACTIVPLSAPPERMAKIKSLAIVSTIGDSWNWESQNFLNHTNVEMSTPEWRMGERVRRLTTTTLAKRFTLVPMPGLNDAQAATMTEDQARARIKSILPSLAFPPDAVLLVGKGGYISSAKVTNASSFMVGSGVYRKIYMFEEYISAYALVSFSLIDGKSGESLAQFDTVLPDPLLKGETVLLWDGMRVPFTFLSYPGKGGLLPQWSERFDDQPTAQRTAVRNTFLNLLDRSVPFTLRKYLQLR